MNPLCKSLSLIALLAASCSDSNKTTVESTEDLTKQAMGGDADAMKELEKQVTEASKGIKKEIEESAAKGDEKALVTSAWLNGGEDKVLELAEGGNTQALFEIGRHYNAMVADKQIQGRDMLIKAAEAGHPRAMFLVGKHSLHGLTGFEKNAETGRSYLEKSAEAGEAEAAYSLGVSLRYGIELTADKAKALEYYKQADKGGFKDPGGELQSLSKELGQ